MTDKINFYFIINLNSGKVKKVINQLEKAILENIDTEKFNTVIAKTYTLKEAKLVINEAANSKNSVVVAVGGDGTVNKTINEIADKEITLGIIPLGSGNALARELNIPLNITKAVKTLNKFQVKEIDLMKVNDKYYSACVGGIGFDALIAKKFEKLSERGLKNYIRLSIQEFIKYKNIEFTLELNGKSIHKEAFLLSFANTRQYGNNAYIAPQAKIDDGIIDIVILKNFATTAAPGLALKLFTKNLDKSKFIEYYKASSFKIIANQPELYLHLDGEPVILNGNTIKVENINKALKVLHNNHPH
jgi:diacylglycerol kinase (ATP)